MDDDDTAGPNTTSDDDVGPLPTDTAQWWVISWRAVRDLGVL